MPTILIIEDDTDLVDTYTDLLETKGYVTKTASNAADAIQLTTRIKPPIVILDLGLPGGSGTDILDFIRSYKPTENTKVMVVTGHSEMTNLGVVDKADLVLSKPVSNEQLLAMIERLLRLADGTILPHRAVSNIGGCG